MTSTGLDKVRANIPEMRPAAKLSPRERNSNGYGDGAVEMRTWSACVHDICVSKIGISDDHCQKTNVYSKKRKIERRADHDDISSFP